MASNVGHSSDGSAASEGWSLSGNKPTAAGLAAAASIRAVAALEHESGAAQEAATNATAPAHPTPGQLQPARLTAEDRAVADSPAPPGLSLGCQEAPAFPEVLPGSSGPPSGQPDTASSLSGPGKPSGLPGSATFVAATGPLLGTAALQHISALQAVLAEAVSLLRSWQQQRVIIALLQLRLKDAAAQAIDGQQRLAVALQQLENIKEGQAQQTGTASIVSAESQQLQLQFAGLQKQLEHVQGDKELLLHGNLQLQASLNAAVAAAGAATDKQQLFELQLQQVRTWYHIWAHIFALFLLCESCPLVVCGWQCVGRHEGVDGKNPACHLLTSRRRCEIFAASHRHVG